MSKPFMPDYASHPGLSLADAFKELKLSVQEAAKKLRWDEMELSDIVRFGKAPIAPELAKRLGEAGIGTEQFWNTSQANYVADCKRLGKWDVFVIEWETRKIDHVAGTACPVKGSFHTVGKRLDEVIDRLNDNYDAVAVRAGVYKKGDIVPADVEEWGGQ